MPGNPWREENLSWKLNQGLALTEKLVVCFSALLWAEGEAGDNIPFDCSEFCMVSQG